MSDGGWRFERGGFFLAIGHTRRGVSLDDGLEDRTYDDREEAADRWLATQAVDEALAACDRMAGERDRAVERASRMEASLVELNVENGRLRHALKLPLAERNETP